MLAVYEVESGRLVSTGTVAPATLPAHLALVDVDPMPERPVWDPAARTFVAGPVAARTRLTRLEMRRRFTLAENVALKTVKATTTDAQVRATLETLEEYTALADHVELTDPDTIAGVQFAVGVLVQVGLIAPAEQAARIAQVLAPAVS